MADQAKTISLQQWAHHELETVELVSGAGTVKVRPTSLARCILGGRIPEHLRAVAEAFHYKRDFDSTTLSDGERVVWEDFVDWIIADSMAEPEVPVAFVHQPDPPDGQPHMNAEDRVQVFRVATHLDLQKRFDEKREAIQTKTLMDLVSFRGGPAGPGAPANGKGAGGAAE